MRRINIDRMAQQLELHEGLRLNEYRDSLDNRTIGIGYNVTGRGVREFEESLGRYYTPRLTEVEARHLLCCDVLRYGNRLELAFRSVVPDNEVRYRVLLDLYFNMGHLHMPKFLEAMKVQDYERAAREMQDSQWYRQVGERGKRLVRMLRTGEDYKS